MSSPPLRWEPGDRCYVPRRGLGTVLQTSPALVVQFAKRSATIAPAAMRLAVESPAYRADSGGQGEMSWRPAELESNVLKRTLFALNTLGGVLAFRNTTGGHRQGGRYIPYGLGGKGGPDIIAFVATGKVAVVVAIEVKRPSGGKVSSDQERWLDRARRYGVVGGFCRTVEEAVAFVNEARRLAA